MKKKLSRIVGVAVSVALVASLCVFAIPAATPAEAGAPGGQSFTAQTLPTNTSEVIRGASNVTDFAVAGDGLTIYVSNDGEYAEVSGAVLVSTDGGQSFKALTVASVTSTTTNRMSAIAVAPDDAQVMAVVEDVGTGTEDVVHLTTNGGKTWTALPSTYVGNSTDIMDIDVGPARSGTVFGREFVLAFADPADDTVAEGDVQIIGNIATWASVDATNATGEYDYMAVKFSPNFVGDRVIAAVGASTVKNDVVLHLLKDSENLQVRAPVGVNVEDVQDYYSSSDNVTIIDADIAFPSDFDPSVSSLQRTYIAFATYTPDDDDDVYRITADSVRELEAVTTRNIKSIAYTGTVDEGTLFIGEYAENNVKYTLDPTVAMPTWKSTKKEPSADPRTTGYSDALTIVRVSPADSNVVFAGTSSTDYYESAFNVSNDAAVSFNAESLIDSVAADTVVTVDDIYLTPDGATIFMATNDGTHLSLWKSSLPTGTTSWSRVLVKTMDGTGGMVRLNPDYGDTPTVYFADLEAAGNIYVSTNGGDTFSTRTAPAGVTAADIVAESSTTLYLAYSSNVYKSTNSAWTWGTPVGGKAGDIVTLAMAASYPALPVEGNLLVGGTGASSYSTDGAATFTKIAGPESTPTYQILAHEDYADNNTIFCGDIDTAETLTYRFVIGEDVLWENIYAAGTTAVSGLGIANGVLYMLQNADDGAARTIIPLVATGQMTWDIANDGIATGVTLNQTPSALRVAGGSNFLYAINTQPTPDQVLAYDDVLATIVPILTAPADGTEIPVDGVTGYAVDIQLAWSSMGTGTGMVNIYDVWIAQAGTGFAAPFVDEHDVSDGLDPGNPQLLVGVTGQWNQNLLANTDYEWKIRAHGSVSGENVRSGWSAVGTFSTQAGGRVEQPHAGPMLFGPVGGAVDVSLTPGFSWAPVFRATEYQFILATDAGLTNTVEGTPVLVTQPSWQVPSTTLEYNTVYFWAVKATKPTVSPQSIGSFTTMAESVVTWTCMQCGLTFTSEAALEAHIADVHAPVTPATPAYIWAIIAIGAVLVIVVIVLITRTRRVV